MIEFKGGNMLRVCVIGLCLMAAACAKTAPLGGPQGVAITTASELPPPERADLFTLNRTYLVGPFDKLRVDVFGIPELSQREFQVDASGRLSFPLIGTVEAAGKSPQELAAALRSGLGRAGIRDPQVTVNLQETVSQVVTVDGEVREPGLYPVIGKMTLMRAVATAKGLGEFAKAEDVVIFRTVGGQKMAALYDLKAIRRGTYQDPEVFANDVVVVGDSPNRRAFKDVVAGAALLSPLVFLLR
ncbi:MAG: polysaccharide biosynthesis/export family protein [Pseudomonadota bacterium]